MSHPASDDDPHRRVERRALGDADQHVESVVGKRFGELWVGELEALAHERRGVVDVDDEAAAPPLDDRTMQLAHPGVEHALEPVGCHELRDHHFERGPCGRRDTRHRLLLLDGVDDLLGDDLAHRRLLEHVGGDVGEPLGVGERPPAPQRDHREVGEEQPEEDRDQ